MTWNYRLVRYRNGSGWGLHEVYYNAAGELANMTEDRVGFGAGPDESPQDIIDCLETAIRDARQWPVLDEPETWAEEGEG